MSFTQRLELGSTEYFSQKEMHGRMWLVQGITNFRFIGTGNKAGKTIM